MLRRNPYTFIGIVSLGFAIIAVVLSLDLGIPLRDPEGFLGPAYVRLPLLALMFFAVGIVPQAIARYGVKRFIPGIRGVLRTDWTWGRFGYIAAGLLAFYTSYVSYRNLKSYLPELRPPTWDLRLERFDHWLFFGNYPSDVLHSFLGGDVFAQFLAVIYVSYLMLIPITLGAYLVLNRDVSIGAWYATALSLNWIMGTISYYILPTVGPAFAFPTRFEELEGTAASELQRSLFRAGRDFIENDQSQSIYGIAGFASLHVSVVFTACLFFERTKIHPLLRVIAWFYFAGTMIATVYFGWHYVSDDIAGLLIGWLAVSLGAWATGNSKRQKRKEAEGHPEVDHPIYPHPYEGDAEHSDREDTEAANAARPAGGASDRR